MLHNEQHEEQNEEFTVVSQQKPDSYWTVSYPLILSELELEPGERALYMYYLEIAFKEGGFCALSATKIEEQLKMSKNTIKKYREMLCVKRDLLGGKPLITAKKSKKANGRDNPVFVQIIDVSRESGDFYRNKQKNMGSKSDNKESFMGSESGIKESFMGSKPGIKESSMGSKPAYNYSVSNSVHQDSVSKNSVSSTMSQCSGDISENQLPDPSFAGNSNRFTKGLNADQKRLHDEIIGYKPLNGFDLKSNDVCAWFLSQHYELERVKTAFEVFKQDEQMNKEPIRSMGAYIVSAIKDKRTPYSKNFKENKDFAQGFCSEEYAMKAMEKYVTYFIQDTKEEIPYDLPTEEFQRQLHSVREKANKIEKKPDQQNASFGEKNRTRAQELSRKYPTFVQVLGSSVKCLVGNLANQSRDFLHQECERFLGLIEKQAMSNKMV